MASTIHILMKTECLVADVTLGVSPYRAEHYILGMILGFFGQFTPFLWSGSNFVM